MQIVKIRRRGAARVGVVAMLAGLAGGCAEQSIPAPVFQKGSIEPIVAPMPAPPPALQVIVKRGQTLAGYAYSYHVPKSALIAANGLRPPYELRTGMRLAIPNMNAPMRQAPPPHVAMATPLPPPRAVQPMPQAPSAQHPIASGALPPQTIFPAQQSATPPAPQQQAAMQPAAPAPMMPPSSAAKMMPEIIPLDGPPPAREKAAAAAPATLTPPRQESAQANAGQSAPSVMPPRNPAAALPLPGEQPAPPVAAAPPPQSTLTGAGGRFPWPVRGRVLASYGSMPGGGHNDGINIAAPRGTPVHAIDGGTVAYAGNEVKGYGNIVLIKHPDGWISAYAHLDDITVKPGDTIAAGQVIAKVGESGGVTEPQLHFELRRGKKPVDPKEFLAPAPSAAGAGNGRAG
ncbi:MAG TPA: LysM peptidoglycan-binding domain-containing M23 family metallopeptidase [Stellaceae bacterium]|nr:LysM peptidoglycan-binding domain-containing M23 family metallopeptidase [Stellaceae bacterium]